MIEAELADGRVLEFPDGTASSVIQATVKRMMASKPAMFMPSGEKAQPGWTSPEAIAGNPATRLALGAAAPVIGGAQLLANAPMLPGPLALAKAVASPFSNDRVAQIERMKQEGRGQLGSEGFDWTEAAGSVVSPAFLAAAKAIPGAGTLVQKILQGMGLGAAGGASAPVTSEGNFAEQKAIQTGAGAAIGGAIPPVAAGAKAVGSGLYHSLVEPIVDSSMIKGRAFLEAAGDKADEIIALLRENKPIVPGSLPTAGEAAVPAGRAEFAALQKSAERVAPSAYLARADEQNAARIAAVRTVGKDQAALDAAKAQRSGNAGANYGVVRDTRIDPRTEAQMLEAEIADRYASKGEALRDAGRFSTTEAQNTVRAENFVPVEGQPRVPGRLSVYPERAQEAGAAASEVMSGVYKDRRFQENFLTEMLGLLKRTAGEDKSLNAFLARPSMRAAVEEAAKGALETGTYFPKNLAEKFSVGNLQRMKMALDDIVKDPATFGLKGTEQAEIQATRDAFVKWLSNKSPLWQKARLQFAQESKPINQMEVGQYLESKLVPALSEDAKQKAAIYAGALRDAPGTIKKATGQPRFKELSEVLTPEQVQVVNSVRDDLARGSRFEVMAQKGSQAAPNAIDLATASREQFGGRLPGILDRGVMIANAIITRMEGKINKKLAGELAAEMLHPAGVAETMAAAKIRQAKIRMLATELGRSTKVAIPVAAHLSANDEPAVRVDATRTR